jgi:hypothetical protein
LHDLGALTPFLSFESPKEIKSGAKAQGAKSDPGVDFVKLWDNG